MNTGTRLAVLLTLGLMPAGALAQDANYWTLQYGNQARLLGGAVIGSASDLSAVFYNPGRLALTDQSEFVIAGNVLESTTIAIDVEDTERTTGNTRFSLSPSLLAGELKFGFLGKGRLAYSFLTRQSSDLRFAAATNGLLPAGSDFVGNTTTIDHRLSEYWTGFTYANRVGDIGVGVTTFVTTRSHRTRTTFQEVAVSDEVTRLRSFDNGYEYSHWGVLWKVGASKEIGDWNVGVTVTTPRVKLFGGGNLVDVTVLVDPTGGVPDVASFSVAQDLPTTYKSPWSVALGLSRAWGKNVFHVGGEAFAGLGKYTVLDGEPGSPQVGVGSPGALVLEGSAGEVVNFAVGFERRESERLRWYASVHSDFAVDELDRAESLAVTAWDLWHVGAGASFKVANAEMTLGAIVAAGANPSLGALESVLSAEFRRLTFILGFNLPFGNPTAG